MSALRTRLVHALVIGVGFCVTAAPASATPITYKDVIGPVKWKVPITIYIPLDPTPGGKAHEDVKKAVEEWNKTTKDKGITLTPVMLDANGNVPGTGQPPDAGAKGSVIVKYVTQAGHASPQFEGEQAGTTADGKPIIKNAEYTNGEMEVGTAAPGLIYVIALHELGHILGLDHDAATDSVMQAKVDDYEKLTAPGTSDKREFDSVYANASGTLQGEAFALGSGLFQYDYLATWLSGGEIPLVSITTFGNAIGNPAIPAGWELVGFPIDVPPAVLAIRVAPTDSLQAYLNADNPTLAFSFESPGGPGTAEAWFGSPTRVVSPVPEPATLLLLGTGLAVGAGVVRRRSGRRSRLAARGVGIL